MTGFEGELVWKAMKLFELVEGFGTGDMASTETGKEAYANSCIFIRVTEERRRGESVIRLL